MISAELKFGQYVLKPATDLYRSLLEDEALEAQFISSCAIPTRWTRLTLIGITPHNHDTSLFRFALPEGIRKLNLPTGSHLLIKAPGCEHTGGDAVRPYTSISEQDQEDSFEIMVKRYLEWGQRETPSTHFLFTKTDHTYRPAGVVSTYIHRLEVGQSLEFKHSEECLGRFPTPLSPTILNVTLIAVGVGIAPMIGIIRYLVAERRNVVLLYGARACADILLKDALEALALKAAGRLRLVYCVGSRWANIHMGAKTKSEYMAPAPPAGFNDMLLGPFSFKEIGWVNEERIRRHGYNADESNLAVVCGLPGVYGKMCGSRFERDCLAAGSALKNIGYGPAQVCKL